MLASLIGVVMPSPSAIREDIFPRVPQSNSFQTIIPKPIVMELFYLEQGWEPSLRFSPHPWPLSIISWVPRTALTQRPHAIVGVPVQNNLRLILVYPVFFFSHRMKKGGMCVWCLSPLFAAVVIYLFVYLFMLVLLYYMKGLQLGRESACNPVLVGSQPQHPWMEWNKGHT